MCCISLSLPSLSFILIFLRCSFASSSTAFGSMGGLAGLGSASWVDSGSIGFPFYLGLAK